MENSSFSKLLTFSLIIILIFPNVLNIPTTCLSQTEPTTLLDGLDYPIGVTVNQKGEIYFTEYASPG